MCTIRVGEKNEAGITSVYHLSSTDSITPRFGTETGKECDKIQAKAQ